jgi:acylphosphatase
MRTIYVRISGKVQGVWFRASTKQEAEKIGVTGWVKNTLDGEVEAIFQGSKEQIQLIIDWCHHGPLLSNVTNLIVKDIDSDEIYSSFSIRY